MENYIKEIRGMLDQEWLNKHTLNLYAIARKQTFEAYHQEASYVHELMKAEGFDSQLLSFPADGKTAYQDKCSPIGWDATTMKLTVVSGVPGYENKVISDMSVEPLMAVKHSVSTPPEGIVARVVTEAQMKAGEDVRGAFVLLDQDTRPYLGAMRMLLDLGAYGWISDFLENPHTTPDSVAWINAGTEHNGWHVQAEDRDFISFQITPRDGFALRAACQKGYVKVHALSDAYRHESTIHAVTAVLPGEEKKEVWMVSHLYEPLIDDNSNGVVGSIAILKALRELVQQGKIHLKYSVRVVFAAEQYGFAAVADYFGGDLSGKTVGAINTDGLMGSTDKSVYRELDAFPAPEFKGGFPGNIFLRSICDGYTREFPEYTINMKQRRACGDDCFLGDSTIGLPVIWPYYGERGYHHNSYQSDAIFDGVAMADHLALFAGWVRAMAAATAKEVEELLPVAVKWAWENLKEAANQEVRPGTDRQARLKFLYERETSRIRALSLWGEEAVIEQAVKEIPLPDELGCSNATSEETALEETPWFDYMDGFVFGRIGCGFPHDLMKRPHGDRPMMPGTILYDPISDVLSRMDGKKTMKTVLAETEWDRNCIFDEKTIRKYFYTCTMLAESGYLTMEVKNPLSSQDLTEALRELGVKEGDTLLVHSSLSGMGYIPGGAGEIIKALKAAVGEEGTFLTPAFARPYVMFEGSVNRAYTYRPYDTRPDGVLRDKTIWTGGLPKAMLKYPGTKRSGHSTHEWVALGKYAEECVAGHGLLDAPAGSTSPLAHALERDGSVVFLGCDVGSNTFLHYVETLVDNKALAPAVVKYLDQEGKPHTALIEKHLPGDRSFYRGLKGDYYQEAIRRGLRVESRPFGMGTLYKMELRQIFDITMEMFREKPDRTI